MRFWTVLVRPWGAKCLILGAKTIKRSQKWRPKSMKIRGCVLESFLEGPWAPKTLTIFRARAPFGDLLATFWRPFSTKSRQKGMKKDMQNSMSKKYRKLCQKASKMMPKWKPKSMKIHTFLKKAEMHKTIFLQ